MPVLCGVPSLVLKHDQCHSDSVHSAFAGTDTILAF